MGRILKEKISFFNIYGHSDKNEEAELQLTVIRQRIEDKK
jgi:hypothetical protein